MKSVWNPCSVPTWSPTAQLITKYLGSVIKVCFCSNNGMAVGTGGGAGGGQLPHLPNILPTKKI